MDEILTEEELAEIEELDGESQDFQRLEPDDGLSLQED